MELGLQNKRAWVTGGSSGIGYSIAEEFLSEGATVMISGRNEVKLKNAIFDLKKISNKVSGVVIDVSNTPQLKKNIEEQIVKEKFDILINNTGGPAAGSPLGIELSDWDKGYDSLLRAPLLFAKLLCPYMREKKWGRILTVTSTSAVEVIPNLPVSSTFRSALTALTKEMARELGKDNILVNNLLPGPTATERLVELKEKSPEFFSSMEKQSPLGRVAHPKEIAKVAIFLCSEANTYLTGTDVLCDGGYTRAI